MIPCEEAASDVFKRMFVQGTPAEVDAQVKKLTLGQSILDAVAGQAKDLQRSVGSRDRDRLDQYFTSVRELEKRMQMSQDWERKPKPTVQASCPLDPASPREYMEKVKLMYDRPAWTTTAR
jgi:BMFP domain-containing protein YqiC